MERPATSPIRMQISQTTTQLKPIAMTGIGLCNRLQCGHQSTQSANGWLQCRHVFIDMGMTPSIGRVECPLYLRRPN